MDCGGFCWTEWPLNFLVAQKTFLLILDTKTATKSDAGKHGCSLIYLKDCFSDYKNKNNVFDVKIHMELFIYTFIYTYVYVHIIAYLILIALIAYLIFYYEEFITGSLISMWTCHNLFNCPTTTEHVTTIFRTVINTLLHKFFFHSFDQDLWHII